MLVLAAGILVPPGLLAGELDEQERQPSAQQLALQIPPLEPEEYTTPPPQFKSLEQGRMLRVEQEAKIQAQTQYLAAKFGQSESSILKYVELAWKEASKRNGMSPEILLAMMQKESSLRPKVQSRYGAQGLMQIVRRWHPDKLHPSESLFDPEVNIRVGADVLEEYLEKAGGSLDKALGQYSGSAQGYATRVLNESYKLARVAAEAARQVLASKG
ncbi:Transglycosylase SLT domain-containing protein [Pollutimonas bauzanensis]|uniref:Transglycosylase SLT domain-containing protein n=2 Tax=Pollutimonas bauzanensis TaxID=658167 RepID=A0A1M6A3S8_9BURK|nr:Transglycosylase SLT domain-containing protein [Pollutimonas bauzanensis]